MSGKSRFVAFNQSSMGSVVALLIGCLLAFPAGYYYKYQSVKANSLAIIAQAKDNERLNKVIKDKQKIRQLSLKQNLKLLGLSEGEISFLYKDDNAKVNKLKSKFTKHIKGKTVYVPRTDCADDFLGDSAAIIANDIIREGQNNRISNQ